MELTNLPSSTFTSAGKRNSATSSSIRTGRFGAMLQGPENKPTSYENVAKRKTHSFAEMPIVAPASEAAPPVETAAESAGQPHAHNVATPAAAIVVLPILPDLQRFAEALHADLTQRITSHLPTPVVAPMRMFARIAPTRAIFAAIASSAQSTDIAGRLGVASPIKGSAYASTLHFAAIVRQGENGLDVRIRTNFLSDDERQELMAHITELAREYGMEIGEIRFVGREGK